MGVDAIWGAATQVFTYPDQNLLHVALLTGGLISKIIAQIWCAVPQNDGKFYDEKVRFALS